MTVEQVPTRVGLPVQHTRPAALPALTAHAVRAFLRNPIAVFFTLAFPLAFLVIVSSIIGRRVTGDGVAVTQFLVAPFAVFGVAQASFTMLAVDTAVLRESGVLLRLRAAPVPAWTVVAARIGASMIVSVAVVALLATVGVLAYEVEVPWRKVPAMLVTLLLGVACCAALGLALASATRTVGAAQTLAQGLLIPLAFISDVFIVGAELPRWLAETGSVLPLKHFAQALAETFRPGEGYGFTPHHLAVLAIWAAAGAVLARRSFGWQPRVSSRPPTVTPARRLGPARLTMPRECPRWAPGALLRGQIGYALLGLRRDPLSVFFAVVFPALLLMLLPTVFGNARIHGLPMAQYLFAGMVAYTAAVVGYVDLTEAVVGARSAGVLKRLRGTPLPFRWYVAGRVCATLITVLLACAVLAAVGISFLGVSVAAGGVPALLLALGAGSLCFSALGLALAALMPSARSLIAVTLGTLLPLCFISEVFVVGDQPLPGPLTAVADVFPLRHLLQALLAATGSGDTGAGVAWDHLSIVAGWTVLALLVARWRRGALAGP
ncbi:ABC transporter permease [Actinoplanes sp. NPDC049118]|uniref:ABC transporter permease n=1 Tax=Actinoplanes sp. NPDC049118 TaxID=3155769 RepID=UPI0033F62BAE